MSFSKELNILLKARYPIIYITSYEEERVEYSFKFKTYHSRKIIYNWNFIDGYTANPNIANKAIKNPLQALDLIENVKDDQSNVFILKDFNKFLTDISVSRKLRNLSRQLKSEPKTIIILATSIDIPVELKDIITILEFPLPTPDEINTEITRLLKNFRDNS